MTRHKPGTIRTKAGGVAAFTSAALFGMAAGLVTTTAFAVDIAETPELAELTLEELGNIDITSVSRHAERLLDAPASIFVISADDIRSAGVNTLPEALRLAPNLEVTRVGASSYAISARGFNSTIANKLLVLIDGRTVYTPLYSGVFWDAQDVMIEDVERIEVISGPGATGWGVNAVNGVINVITRSAANTRGGVAVAHDGSLERGLAVRYGGALGADGSYRLYGKAFDVRGTTRADGTSAGDAWNREQIGFRTDWGRSTNVLTVQGDAYHGRLDQFAAATATISGANLTARWNRDLDGGGHFQIQAYEDHTERRGPEAFDERLDIYDVEFLHTLNPLAIHHLSWGGGYRFGDDHVTNSAMLAFMPPDRTLHWSNLFVQDEIALDGDKLRLTVGGKVASNPYTSNDSLPSVRLAWKPDQSSLVWGGLSRAVRAPSRIDREFYLPGQAPFLLAGGPDFDSEITKVAEVGYHAQISTRASYSLSLYRNWHDRLRSIEPVLSTPGTFVVGNKMGGTTTGVEAWGNFQATSKLRLSAGGFFLKQKLRLKPDSLDIFGVSLAGNDPKYQWRLQSSLDLPGRAEFNASIRRVGPLPDPYVPAHTVVDLRYSFYPWHDVEASLSLQNLFDRSHAEFGDPLARSEIRRGANFKLQWAF